jgi:exosortase
MVNGTEKDFLRHQPRYFPFPGAVSAHGSWLGSPGFGQKTGQNQTPWVRAGPITGRTDTHGDGVRAENSLFGGLAHNMASTHMTSPAKPESRTPGERPPTSPPSNKGAGGPASPPSFALPAGLWPLAAVSAGLVGLCCWVYWPSLVNMVRTWWSDPQYSHGYLVPAFAVVLLWLRRSILLGPTGSPESDGTSKPASAANGLAALRGSWWGLALLGFAGLLRVGGAYLNYDWVGDLSLLPCLAGLFVLLGGWQCLAWAWPAVAFLFFMIPLPYGATYALSGPLRGLATQASTYALQTLGLPALAEGHTILLPSGPVAVAEACSGLSMLFVFLAISLAMALVIKRPLLDKALVLASAVPIALLANTARITATGLALEYLGHRAADLIFHDLAGWLMMPFALGVLWLELKVTDWILKVPVRPETVVPGLGKGAGVVRKGAASPQAPEVPGIPASKGARG